VYAVIILLNAILRVSKLVTLYLTESFGAVYLGREADGLLVAIETWCASRTE